MRFFLLLTLAISALATYAPSSRMEVAKAVICSVPCAYKHRNVFKEESRPVNREMLGVARTIKCVTGISPGYGGIMNQFSLS
jgi:hypothetical protein